MTKDRVSDRLAVTGENAFVEIDRRIDLNEELTEEERALIKKKAREHVLQMQEERREAARQKLVEQATDRAIKDAEKAAGIHGAYVDISIDLAPNAPYLLLDGTFYYHGVTYEVPHNVACTIIDICARTWEHENEINGRPRRQDMGRRQVQRVLGPQHLNMSAQAINQMPQV